MTNFKLQKKSLYFAFIFSISMLSVSVAFAAPLDQISELKKQIEQLTKQAEQYRQAALAKQSDAASLKNEIASINANIARIQTEIQLSTKQISEAAIEISAKEADISEHQKIIAREKAAIGELLRFVYEQQRHTGLATLLESKTISEFANEAQHAQDYTNNLNDAVKQLRIESELLESAKVDLSAKKKGLENLKTKNELKRNSLGDVNSQKNTLLKQTKGEENKYRQMLSNAEKQQASLFKELKDLEAQAYKDKAFIVHVTVNSVPPKGTILFKSPFPQYRMNQKYGYTTYALKGSYGGQPHSGVDLVAWFGAEIYSIGPGKIVASGTNTPGWGNWVAVQHDNNFVSLYAHMQIPTPLAVGVHVDNATAIGYEGSTGNSTGAHLHLSLYTDFFTYTNSKNGLLYPNYIVGTVNPQDYIDIN